LHEGSSSNPRISGALAAKAPFAVTSKYSRSGLGPATYYLATPGLPSRSRHIWFIEQRALMLLKNSPGTAFVRS
jgi:hypothetical protein